MNKQFQSQIAKRLGNEFSGLYSIETNQLLQRKGFLVILKNWKFKAIRHLATDYGNPGFFSPSRLPAPIVISEKFLQEAGTVFPLEFSVFKSHYQLILGDDLLKDLKIEAVSLVRECDREIKQKMLSFCSSTIACGLQAKELQNILKKLTAEILEILAAILRASGSEDGCAVTDIVAKFALLAELELPHFDLLVKLIVTKGKIDRKICTDAIEQIAEEFDLVGGVIAGWAKNGIP